MVGGSLTLEGGTITGNTTTAQGGGVFVKNGTLTVKDGAVITGNTAAEGGGVYATGSSTVNIYGGEISHNTATSTVMDRGGITPQGGGGIAAVGSVKLTMSGGVICDNTAAGAGGGIGIRRSEGTDTPVFTMTGGAVTRNTAEAHEGGGIRLEGTGTINPTDGKIEITGNICNTESDLGGGGLFVSTESSVTMRNAVITENSAGGLGGGFAGCIYGEISNLSADGAAIYGNTAKGENFTTSESGRADRREVLKKALQDGTAPVFTNTVKYTPPETPPEEPNDKPDGKPDKPVEVSGDSPQTGDTTGIFIWIGLLTASLTGCITIILFSRKKRYNTKRIR